MTIERLLRGVVLAFVLVGSAHATTPGASLQLEELTWTELRARIDGGARTALVPIGGTEQSGPQIALGKHNMRAKLLAERIARELGNAVVAPVIAYVPEGPIDPPAGHMRFAGTLSIGDPAFEAMLDGAARSLCRHGFTDVVFLGDHGSYQGNLQRVATKLTRERAGRTPACRVHALVEYYRAAQDGHAKLLAARGYNDNEIGTHAGLADTALTLALDPSLVRTDRLDEAMRRGSGAGVHGDPRRASAELGQIGVDRIVSVSVAAIRARIGAR